MPLKTGAWATGPRDGEHALPSVPLTHEMKTSVVFVWAGESGSWTHEAHSLQRGTDHIWADKQPFMKEDEKHTVLKIVFVFLVHVKQKEWPV